MKQFIGFFKYIWLILVILFMINIPLTMYSSAKDAGGARNNDECTETERVFDYGEKLTEEEEEALRELIAVKEAEAGCDIVLVTLDVNLMDGAPVTGQRYAGSPEAALMHYADDFYDERAYGYDTPHGTGVIFVDNWDRSVDGYAYSWFSTSGRAINAYSETDIDNLIDAVMRRVNESPYEAYTAYVNKVADHMTKKYSPMIPVALALTATVVFLVVTLSQTKAEKTTTASTYISGGKERLTKKEDIFSHKVVNKRHIPRNTGGSGGGGHISSGGHSHGGGGGRH